MRFIMEIFPIFSISNDLLQLLISWKEQQRYELAHATLHKLRHTSTTQIYVNTPNVVPMAVGEFALKSLKQ